MLLPGHRPHHSPVGVRESTRSQQECGVLWGSLGTTSSHPRSRMAEGKPASAGTGVREQCGLR